MVLSAQRFRHNETLRKCVDEGYRMHSGERDREAVKQLQFALNDLRYSAGSVDGIWGHATSSAVVQFKKEEELRPTDAVASVKTIGQLCTYFAHEPDEPDDPDPTTSGLIELAETTAATAAAACEQTALELEKISWGAPPSDLEEERLRAALVAHTGIDAASASSETEAHRVELQARVSELVADLSPISSDLTFEALDREGWHAEGHSFYWSYRHFPDEHRLRVTPPFRNVLRDVDRLGIVLKAGLRNIDPNMTSYGYPGTPRYAHMSTQERRDNMIGIANLIIFAGAGLSDYLRPPMSWGTLASL